MDSVAKSQCCDEDRISNLPAHVVHHILSFLTMEELFRLCLTSKKHRELCISIPVLTIDGIEYESAAKRAQVINFMDRLLSLRKGIKTRQITLCWSFEDGNSDDEYRVLTWLNNAIGCKLQMLDHEFIFNEERPFSLPLDVFLCESLMELKVNLHGGILKLPSTDGCCKLQSLTLKDVGIFDQNFGEWLSSFCKNLKRLFLVIHGIKNISIRSSCLQHLEIMTPESNESDFCNISLSAEMLKVVKLHWIFNSSNGTSFNIIGPNLESFEWKGSIASSYCLGNLEQF